MTVLALYLAGAGLARYLGARMDFSMLGIGLAWLLCLFLGLFLLGDYFQISFLPPILPAEPSMKAEKDQRKSSFPNLLLFSSLALLSTASMLTILMGVRGMISPAVGVILAGSFVFSTANILPGLNLKYSGVGEFLLSICLVIFPPALAFLTQYGEFHHFLSLAIFPLFPLHLALILTLELRSYPADFRAELRTLMVRLGWVRGIFFHNMLLLSAFVLFGAALLFGLPLRITGPVFFTLIPAGYLIWIYTGLERGGPVRWPIIILLALIVFFLPLYLITFTVWVF
jgi:hypothetical protein